LSVVTASLLAVVGLVALTVGADALVRGSSRLAIHFGVSPLVVGLTIVAYGTSAPELVASLVAAVQGHPEVSIGNVLGSNVANTGLILGGTALLAPVLVARSILRRELPLMTGATVLFALVALRLELGRVTGLVFIVLLVLFNYLTFRWSRQDTPPVDSSEERLHGSRTSSLLLTAGGLLFLLGGAHLLVVSAVSLAQRVGVSDFVIGVTLVAIGTSLPELATSFVAGLRKEVDLVVGNIVGSNIFNILGALGLSAAVTPIPIESRLLRFEFPALLVFTFGMALFAWTGRVVSRFEGLLLVAGYFVFIALVLS
jgi:cation:H+ antiporter